jgi:TonB family protein
MIYDMEFIVYLFKVNVALVLFYGFYRLFFQRDTFFVWKRAILLFILLVSFLYPLGDISRSLLANPAIRDVLERGIWPSFELPELIVAGASNKTDLPWKASLPMLFLAVYAWIAFLLFVRTMIQTGVLLYQIGQMKRIRLQGRDICLSPGLATPYSFFHWIILDSSLYTEKELAEILLHEEIHARQRHSIDTLLAEAVCAFCWFNPFAWLMKREIRMNLEFIADRFVLNSGYEAEHYQFHLLRLSYHKATAKLSNNFNVSLLKKRIFMMNKKQTSLAGLYKYGLLIPLVGMLAFFNSCLKIDSGKTAAVETAVETDPPVQPEEKAKEIFNYVEIQPVFPGGENELMKWLMENIRYPEDEAKSGIQGRVIVRFVINDDGRVSDGEIVRSLSPAFDQEALRVVQAMPEWIPGKQNGKAVNVSYTVPILFKTQK